MNAEQPTPKATDTPQAIGLCGQFLKDHGITSNRLPDSAGVETLELSGSDLLTALELLKNDSKIGLDLLLTISGVDNPDSFDSVYHLWSYSNKNELVIKVKVNKAGLTADKLPVVPSAAKSWSAANWHERETYDLVGIRYTGHPYLRRILNPWDWEGYPLRRDYKQLVDALNDKHPHSFR